MIRVALNEVCSNAVIQGVRSRSDIQFEDPSAPLPHFGNDYIL